MNNFLFDMDNEVHYGNRIKEFLESRDESLVVVAEKLGYNLESLYPIFKKPDLNTKILRKISEVYGVTTSRLLSKPYEMQSEIREFAEPPAEYGVKTLASLEKENAVLKAENRGLQEQIKLLREMVDVLKSRG